MPSKVVICGAGFIGLRIAHAISQANSFVKPLRHIQISSRSPEKLDTSLHRDLPSAHVLPLVPLDITKPEMLDPAFHGANVVVSLVGVLTGSPKTFEEIQWQGAENVARAARRAGAKLVHMSALGANKDSKIPYERTKALGEDAAFRHCPDATVIRPSLVFGPGDGFFGRFAQLSKFLPFLPVFGDGSTRFQPVFVDDLARLVELVSRDDAEIRRELSGRIVYAGGPDIFTFRDIMKMVLKYTGRTRPIIHVPWAIGNVQGAMLEKLPPSVLTLTRDQVKQLKHDNTVPSPLPPGELSLADLLRKHFQDKPTSAHRILPKYLA
ncbi:NAD-P-binding protein [Vararia minispora EC-137]|uniref:NAD-P-binding protein n=1 Tax=Vararia minispora EC-137 TaxID=1314806 RepID=A0ACB8QR17_9AGAM|nr:NAD-P-binding protein [Vararia minispora EC-137]